MSDFGRHWSLKIRGCNIAEHAVAFRLGDYHHEKTGLCFPGRERLSFELECSFIYLTQVFQSLELKKFLLREKRFEPSRSRLGRKGKQTSNLFRLNFDRWFPFSSEEVEREEKRLLGYFRRAVESPQLAQGFLSTWLEKPYVPKESDKPNSFKSRGLTIRKTIKRPVSTVLWIALASEGHERHLVHHLPDIMKNIREDTHHNFDVEILKTWLKKPQLSSYAD